MKKITITIPEEKGKWKIRYGNSGMPSSRKSAELIIRWVERKSFSLAGKEKTAVIIKDGSLVVNESLDSQNPKYLIWITVCFLEEYLNKEFIKTKLKLYEGSEP